MTFSSHATTTAERYTARITAIGSYTPERILTNAHLEEMVDTSDEWIVQRTGIRERRISAPDEHTSDLCVRAVEQLVERYGTRLDDVDVLIVATSTPDFAFPATASLVQDRLGIPHTLAFDLSAACAGFVYGLHTASGLIASGLHRKALVIGADALSKITDYTDRTTCILFGDGAGAVIMERDDEGATPSFLAYTAGSDGSGGAHLYRSLTAASLNGAPVQTSGKLVQNGREVYRFAVQTVPRGVEEILAASGLEAREIDWFLPHSANLRILESVADRTGIPLDKTLHTIERYGNTSAATIALALDEAVQDGKVQDGDKLLLLGFGGGFVYGALLLQWKGLSPLSLA